MSRSPTGDSESLATILQEPVRFQDIIDEKSPGGSPVTVPLFRNPQAMLLLLTRAIRRINPTAIWSIAYSIVFLSSAFGQETSGGIEPRVAQILSDKCFNCHGHEEPEAGLDLKHFTSIKAIRDESQIWNKVLRRVTKGSMPPEEAPELNDYERAFLAKWIDGALHDINCTDAAFPGHMTIRRLNRLEYQNSVRDLLLLDYTPAASFPGDDSGYGFDNIGDVLSLPPVLMEKYLDAAEKISRQVIQAPEDLVPAETLLEINQWKLKGGINTNSGSLTFYSQGKAAFTITNDSADDAIVRIKAVGEQAGDEPVKMSVFLDKRKLGQYKLKNHEQYETVDVKLRLPKGSHTIRITFDNDFYNEQAPDKKNRDRNLIVQSVTLVRSAISGVQPSEMHKNFIFVVPKKRAEEEAAANKLLSVWTSRFFRRPNGDNEVDRLLKIFTEARTGGDSFERSMQYALQAILISPKFLYKVERPAPADGTPRDLTSFELATSLSYFLWCTTPDADLLQTALKKDLQDEAVLRAEVKRMLSLSKSDQLVENFAVQWLQLRPLATIQPDPVRFVGVDQPLLSDMRRETELFCREIMRRDQSVLQLLSADFTFVNRRLAEHYGLSNKPKDNETFLRVSLVGTERGGLLTQGSILAVTSNPTRTSPVKRGKWILENLLGEPPPPPLPDVMPLEQQELTGSLREKMEQHRRDPSCAQCHDLMDPLGFALENFDAIGRWRTKDSGIDVNASGKLPSGEVFTGAAELRNVLLEKKKDEFVRCVTEKMMIYALGRGLRYEDQCAVNEITRRLEANDYRFSELIFGIVESPPFRKRQLKLEK